MLALKSSNFRVFWIIVTLVTVAGCAWMLLHLYKRHDSTPMVVSFATQDSPIQTIPFPAITICPEIKEVEEGFVYNQVLADINEGKTIPNETYWFKPL